MPDSALSSRYIAEQLRAGFSRIFAEQLAIASRSIYAHRATFANGSTRSRSASLRDALEHPSYLISSNGAGVNARIDYPTYIRFLDMKQLGNYRIYNRPIWGILYKETFNNIRYEFRDWLARTFADSLSDAYGK